MLLVEARKRQPERGGLADSLLRVDRLDGGGVGLDGLGRLRLEEPGALEPLVDRVRVLTEQNRREQLGSPFHEPLQPLQSHVQLELRARRRRRRGRRALSVGRAGLPRLELGPGLLLCLPLDERRDERLFKLRVGIENHREIAHLQRGWGACQGACKRVTAMN